MLTIKDFEKIKLPSGMYYYETQLGNGYTATLEFCLNGFDVVVYKKGKGFTELVGQKECTNLKQHIIEERQKAALKIINQKIKQLKL